MFPSSNNKKIALVAGLSATAFFFTGCKESHTTDCDDMVAYGTADQQQGNMVETGKYISQGKTYQQICDTGLGNSGSWLPTVGGITPLDLAENTNCAIYIEKCWKCVQGHAGDWPDSSESFSDSVFWETDEVDPALNLCSSDDAYEATLEDESEFFQIWIIIVIVFTVLCFCGVIVGGLCYGGCLTWCLVREQNKNRVDYTNNPNVQAQNTDYRTGVDAGATSSNYHHQQQQQEQHHHQHNRGL